MGHILERPFYLGLLLCSLASASVACSGSTDGDGDGGSGPTPGCPAAEPDAGDPCAPEGQLCPYDEGRCPSEFRCYEGSWRPVSQPSGANSGKACSEPGLLCEYHVNNHLCGSDPIWAYCKGSGVFETEQWASGCADPCPETLPEEGTDCVQGPAMTCTYVVTTACGEQIQRAVCVAPPNEIHTPTDGWAHLGLDCAEGD